MRRLFLPILVAAFWLASLAGAGWMHAQCVRECMAAAQAVEHVPSCCAKHADKHEVAGKGGCTTSDCPKCKALAKAQLAVAATANAPLFFDTVCGTLQPVVVASSAPVFAPARAWQWSLPPPDTLLNLHCQLLI